MVLDSTILHLGLGAFHRAHQADYLQDLYDLGDESWQIVAGNIRPFDQVLIESLAEQGGEYTLETLDERGVAHYRRIKTIKTVVPWHEDLASLVAWACDPSVKIISFTVTEAGYYLDSDNELVAGNADLASDLTEGTALTLYGALAKMLAARSSQLDEPVTLQCCDNLLGNGDRFGKGFKAFLRATRQADLLAWVEANTSTPNSMVDRITPKPTPAVMERVAQNTGINDPASLMSERFKQWVIEDRFIAGRPNWERAGVLLVGDVEPYETAKIRLLNASHSCIAWAGALAGHEMIYQAVGDAAIREFAFRYMTDSAIPLLYGAVLNLPAYRDQVLARFSSPYIPDTCSRVLTDSAAKLTGFILPTIRESIAEGRPLDAVMMLPAFYLSFLLRYTRGVVRVAYSDQSLSGELMAKLKTTDDPVTIFAAESSLFEELAGDRMLVEALQVAFERSEDFASQV